MTAICAVVLDAGIVFAACLVLHAICWRVYQPQSYRHWVPALGLIFLGAGPVLAWILLRRGAPGIAPVERDAAIAWLAVLLVHVSASMVYLIGYTLVSAFSPSVEILKLLDRTPGGLARDDIDLPFLRAALGGNRVENLLTSGLVLAQGDDVRLGPKAQVMTRLMLLYRHLIGLPDGAGG